MMQTTPARYIARHNNHCQGKMEWQGETIKVDDGLQPLLLAFNRFDGIATVSSCIGYPAFEGKSAFITFKGDTPEDARNLIGCLFLDFDVEVNLEYDGDLEQGCMRWKPEDFAPVLAWIQSLFEKTQPNSEKE